MRFNITNFLGMVPGMPPGMMMGRGAPPPGMRAPPPGMMRGQPPPRGNF